MSDDVLWEFEDYLNCGRIDRLERAILGVLTGFNQISDAPVLAGVVNIFLFLMHLGK